MQDTVAGDDNSCETTSVESLVDEILSSRHCHNGGTSDADTHESVTQEEYLVWAVNHPALPSDFLRLLTQVRMSPVPLVSHARSCQVNNLECHQYAYLAINYPKALPSDFLCLLIHHHHHHHRIFVVRHLHENQNSGALHRHLTVQKD